MRILAIVSSSGGIADYAHDQANALADLGCEVELLCTRDFIADRTARYHPRPELPPPSAYSTSRSVRRLRHAHRILSTAGVLARSIEQDRHRYVLTHFSEYLAPVWAPRLRRLQAKGVTFASVLHDPVRNYVVGPRAWHDWSVRQAFSFLDCVFVHAKHELPDWVKARNVVIPHGIQLFSSPDKDRATVRSALNIPSDAKVLIVAGYIRDDKNIDLLLKAFARIPQLYLIVAGSNAEAGNKPASFYQDLARTLGCADRCRWIIGYVDTVERGNLLQASDLCALTYSRSFRSASGVLAGTANYRLPSICSAGAGPMQEIVKTYGLGIWVEPDSVEAIEEGLRRWIAAGVNPNWESYLAENSWAENARRVISAFSEATPPPVLHGSLPIGKCPA